jgi:hypothetical protein
MGNDNICNFDKLIDCIGTWMTLLTHIEDWDILVLYICVCLDVGLIVNLTESRLTTVILHKLYFKTCSYYIRLTHWVNAIDL